MIDNIPATLVTQSQSTSKYHKRKIQKNGQHLEDLRVLVREHFYRTQVRS